MAYAWELIGGKEGHDGGFRIVDGQLYCGAFLLNGNFEIVDQIKKIGGGVATIFAGDTRVATNVLKADGSRALDSKLSAGPTHAIFREGRSYRGKTEVVPIRLTQLCTTSCR